MFRLTLLWKALSVTAPVLLLQLHNYNGLWNGVLNREKRHVKSSPFFMSGYINKTVGQEQGSHWEAAHSSLVIERNKQIAVLRSKSTIRHLKFQGIGNPAWKNRLSSGTLFSICWFSLRFFHCLRFSYAVWSTYSLSQNVIRGKSMSDWRNGSSISQKFPILTTFIFIPHHIHL